MIKRMLIGMDISNMNKRIYYFNFDIDRSYRNLVSKFGNFDLPITYNINIGNNNITVTKSPAAHWSDFEDQIVDGIISALGTLVIEQEPAFKRFLCWFSAQAYGNLDD